MLNKVLLNFLSNYGSLSDSFNPILFYCSALVNYGMLPDMLVLQAITFFLFFWNLLPYVWKVAFMQDLSMSRLVFVTIDEFSSSTWVPGASGVVSFFLFLFLLSLTRSTGHEVHRHWTKKKENKMVSLTVLEFELATPVCPFCCSLIINPSQHCQRFTLMSLQRGLHHSCSLAFCYSLAFL